MCLTALGAGGSRLATVAGREGSFAGGGSRHATVAGRERSVTGGAGDEPGEGFRGRGCCGFGCSLC